MSLQVGKMYRYKEWPPHCYYFVHNVTNDLCQVTYFGTGVKESRSFHISDFGQDEHWILVIDFEEELNSL